MANNTIPFPMSALHEILKWSEDRPDWQRDALRRIVTQDTLSEVDRQELNRLCRAKHGADNSKDSKIAACNLTANHLPPAPGDAQSVTLVSISNLQRVNRLPTDQVLSFGDAPGLTVIYGDNGSGKSGYGRVIRKACRTRGTTPPIKPNAFAPAPKGAASADIACRVGGNDEYFSWNDGATPHPALGNVFMFDTSTAGHYLQEDGPAIFTPHGLDVLPKLSKICDEVSGLIQSEITIIKADIQAKIKNWKFPANTKVGRFLGALSAKATEQEVNTHGLFEATDSKRLADLSEALKADAKQKAKETRASAARLKAFAVKVASIAKEMADVQVNVIKSLLSEAQTAEIAAQAFASGQFDATYLDGTGGALWRSLFEAARQFSVTEAYKGREFPVTDEAKCVLCQQEIAPPAKERLLAFDSFCKNQSQKLAAEAAKRLSDTFTRIGNLEALKSGLKEIDADLSSVTPEQKTAITTFVDSADLVLATVVASLAAQTWTETMPIPSSPEKVITDCADALEARARMEESADNPDERKKLTDESDELTAKEWLSKNKEDVLEQIRQHQLISKLEKCKKDTATRGITEKNSELTKRIVTDAFCQQFQEEIKFLGLRTIAVKMEDIKGKKGETCFGLRLVGGEGHKIHEVASEGEQRCISLAAFLAELSQAAHRSTLVFDDPVSSLDHWNRDTIAARLVKESKIRQVVVLTHDAVFLNDLKTHAEKQISNLSFRYLEWLGNSPGKCHEGLPWDCKSPEDRLDQLEKKHTAIAANWSPQPNESNKTDMRDAYSWLRATLERMVEKVVFADVVFRFRSYVKLKDLKEVVGFSETECDELLRLHKRCCDVTDSHDAASGKQAPVPEPTQLWTDITSTKTLLSAIRLRRKTKSKSSTVPTARAVQ